MEIKELLVPVELEYSKRLGNIDAYAEGVVKSKKNFPIYMIDGIEYVFKPLSKTKPMTTDMFSYAEVYWSYVINKYFDKDTPLYRLAYCRGIEDKYYEKGTLVRKIGNGKFSNLLTYFNEYPDSSFDISNYINYCMVDYDYTMILSSSFIKENDRIGKKLVFQILLSILRMDQNFHYENINLDKDDGYQLIAPIDFEFSTPFLYPDMKDRRSYYINKYMNNLVLPSEFQYIIRDSMKDMNIEVGSIIFRNIYYIVVNYPDVVDYFLECLSRYEKDIDKINLSDIEGFIGSMNSDYWEVGHAKYKDNDLDKADKLSRLYSKVDIDKEEVFKLIKDDIRIVITRIRSIIKGIRILMDKGFSDRRDFTIDNLYSIVCKDIDKELDGEDIIRKILEYKINE